MSAIRFGTPIVCWWTEYGTSPHRPIEYELPPWSARPLPGVASALIPTAAASTPRTSTSFFILSLP